jgi:hypothetical protein
MFRAGLVGVGRLDFLLTVFHVCLFVVVIVVVVVIVIDRFCSFLWTPKEKNQKKGRPCHLSACGGFPARPRSYREFTNSPPAGAQTV